MRRVFAKEIRQVLFLLLVWMAGSLVSHAQAPVLRFENLSANEGLSENTVNCILQDREGMLWFGTNDGLNRYDGYQFSIYRTQPDDSTSLSNNIINCLAMDAGGTVWAGTSHGLNRYDKRQNRWRRFFLSSGPERKQMIITAIQPDGPDLLTVATNSGSSH